MSQGHRKQPLRMCKPIGTTAGNIYALALVIFSRIGHRRGGGAVQVFVRAGGDVYVVCVESLTAAELMRTEPFALVGTYKRQATCELIVGDIHAWIADAGEALAA